MEKSYKYSKDLVLSLYKPMPPKAEILEMVFSEGSLPPMAQTELTETEIQVLLGIYFKIYNSGSINSEIVNKRQGSRNGRQDFRGRGRGRQYNQNTQNRQSNVQSENAWNKKKSIDDEQLPEDLWELPSQETSGGTFENGAFTLDAGNMKKWRNPIEREQFVRQSSQISYTPNKNMPAQHVWSRVEPGIPPQMEIYWQYKDPQGNIQGPFTGIEMQQWYEARYFPENLLIRSNFDENFEPLIVYFQKQGGIVLFTMPPRCLGPYQQNNPLAKAVITEPFVAIGRGVPIQKAWNLDINPAQSKWSNVYSEIQNSVEPSHPTFQELPVNKEAFVPHVHEPLQQVLHSQPIPGNLKPEKKSPLEEKFSDLKIEETIKPKSPEKQKEIKSPWNATESQNKKKSLAEIQKEEQIEKANTLASSSGSSSKQPKRYSDTVSNANAWSNNAILMSSLKPNPSVAKNLPTHLSAPSKSSSMESLYTAPSGRSTPNPSESFNEKVPSDETLAWCREQLKPLSGKIDELLPTMKDPESIMEIVHDVIGAHFSIVNPNQFASEYLKRIHKEKKLPGNPIIPNLYSSTSKKSNEPKKDNSDKGFVQVTSKKKKKAQINAEKNSVPVGVGGKHVVGATIKK